MCILEELRLSQNKIGSIPADLLRRVPSLKYLDISNNVLEEIPTEIAFIEDIEVFGNPLSGIPDAFRNNKKKLIMYVRYSGKTEPWNQLKLMLVGHEGVGKTTFVRSLQGQQAPASKNINLSTNGVDITQVDIAYTPDTPSLDLRRLTRKLQKIDCRVWDFAGQSVFHNTHRFFLTASAVYIVLFNMADESTYTRLQYPGISAIIDSGGTMPIFIVGTHADKLSRQEQDTVLRKVVSAFPLSNSNSGIQGYFAISLKNDQGIQELKSAIASIAKSHPQIGVGKVMVPSFLMLVKERIMKLVEQGINYISWNDYERLFVMEEIPLVQWTRKLQDLGVVVWNNSPTLRDVVVINPKWLADALAGVVTIVNQSHAVVNGGVVLRSKLYSAMLTKIPNPKIYPIILGFLERFQIILKLRNYYLGLNTLSSAEPTQLANSSNTATNKALDDFKYFIPSLLLPYDPAKDLPHPARQFFVRLNARKTISKLKRRYTWKNFPAGFFPRLLLCLMHVQISLLGSWVDAAVVMSQDQQHVGFLHLFSQNNQFILEVTVLHENETEINANEPLISTLSYAITRLHADSDKAYGRMRHDVVVIIKNGPQPEEFKIPFSSCIDAVANNQEFIEIEGQKIKLISATPDLSCCAEIPDCLISEKQILAKGGFGVVHKGVMNNPKTNERQIVAIKELQNEEGGTETLLEFQHEMQIASKLIHKNLVQLHGITLSPLSMVMEFVECGDLFKLSCTKRFLYMGLKWRLKMAIDIARGMSYLHKQTPPICHSDLRSPNVFIASFNEDAEIVGKVADFGLARQVFTFSTLVLGNVVETAPETWGDEGTTKGAMYDERSDVFSYAMILWQLFGCSALFYVSSSGRDSSPSPSPSSRSSSLSQSTSPSRSPPNSLTFSTSPPTRGSKMRCDSAESIEPQNPYSHLVDNKGRSLAGWKLREKIKEGERPIIHSGCPTAIKQVIEECWKTNASMRPFFPIITQILENFYVSKFGTDKYVPQSSISPAPVSPRKESPRKTLKQMLGRSRKDSLLLQEKNFEPKIQISSDSWAVEHLLYVSNKIWAGTNTGAVLVVNPETSKMEHLITLKKRGRVSLVQVGPSCIWATCETEKICVIHALTNYKVTEIDNQVAVTCMQVCYHNAGPTAPVVWVADITGCVSLWDATTLQKYCQFVVMEDPIYGDNPPIVRSMCVVQEYIWLAAGGDIVVYDTQTLAKVSRASGSARLNGITTDGTKQVWTCSKDGWVKAWMYHKQSKNIDLIAAHKSDREVKTINCLSSVVPHYNHVVTGDLDGNVFCWNYEQMTKPKVFPVPQECKKYAIQYILDTGENGLWIGTMNSSHPLIRYNWKTNNP